MYITKDKYFNYVSALIAMDLDDELYNELMNTFHQSLGFDPNKSTYSPENYHKSKEKNLEKSGGVTSRSPSQKRANDKYNESKREERNRKARERYHRLKQLSNLSPSEGEEDEEGAPPPTP